MIVHDKPFQHSQMIVSKTGAYASDVLWSRVGSLSLTHNCYNRMKWHAKNCSLLRLFINYVQKKFDNILTPGVKVIKLFSSLQKMRPNKLECLYLAITFQSSLTFAGNTRGLPKKVIQLSLLWPCPQILKPDWKRFPRTNPLAYWALSLTLVTFFFETSKLWANILTLS